MKQVNDLQAVRVVPGTKISHDYEEHKVTTFSYKELIDLGIPSIGIPCKQNRLIIIDVDVPGADHKFDGRPFWSQFCQDNNEPATYTVRTSSGGYHFYYWLPDFVPSEAFTPPDQLAPGVDVKWNGWAKAPPTPGYDIFYGNLDHIQVASPALMALIDETRRTGKNAVVVNELTNTIQLDVHKPFSSVQIADLRRKIEWVQQNGTLSRDEWRDGIFSLKAGVEDPEELADLVVRWTMNQSYTQGDEHTALDMANKADRYGKVGPGTIFSIIKNIMIREGAPIADTPWSLQEILDRSKINYIWKNDGTIKLETSEYNASAVVGAIYDINKLYHDLRSDRWIYEGRPVSDKQLVNMMLPKLQSSSSGLGMEKFRKTSVSAGIEILMSQRGRDPHMEYLNSLQWDGIQRVETFFIDVLGGKDTQYNRLAAKAFWTGLAARGLHPGCQMDYMLVLEGAEGIRKSSLVRELAGGYIFTPVRDDVFSNENELRKMHQSVIVELPELKGLKGKDQDYVKGCITIRTDDIRDLYAQRSMPKPRGFVMIGTTNDEKYLSQGMGWRRFLPFAIPSGFVIDIDKFKNFKDQYFAEAKALYLDGYKFWEIPEDIHKAEVEKRVIQDPLRDEALNILETSMVPLSVTDVYTRLEQRGFLTKGLSASVMIRIENILNRSEADRTYENGRTFWKLKARSPEVIPDQIVESFKGFLGMF